LPAKQSGSNKPAIGLWLVSFMDYDLGYFDDETCKLEPLAKPLRSESIIHVSDET